MNNDIIVIALVVVLIVFAVVVMKRHEKKKFSPAIHETPSKPTEQESKQVEHSSGLATALSFIGALSIISGILIAVYYLEIGISAIISGFILFALAELVFNTQYQTKLLKKLLDK